MTTITVEVDKDNDLLAVKEFIGTLGLNYRVNNKESIYTDELKKTLDDRYDAYLNGSAELISAEESRKKIQAMLTAAKK